MNREFKDIIKELRLKKGLSQKELARVTRLSLSAIGKFEKGQKKPKASSLIIFALSVRIRRLIHKS